VALRAAVYYGREDLRIEDVPEPVAGPGDVKLRVRYAGICGSDLHEYYHGPVFTLADEPHPITGVKNPVILGHELCGEVVAVGSDVEGLEAGDLVGVAPSESCGRCGFCAAGEGHRCRQKSTHGYTRPGGGFSEYTVVSRGMAHRLPLGMTAELGALLEPMSVGLTAVVRSGAREGQTSAVHGLGPIGLAAAFALRARGLETIVSDPSELRRSKARELGFEHVLDPLAEDVVEAILELTDGHGVQVSIDAAGVPAALDSAFRSTDFDGSVVMVAVPLKPIVLDPELLRLNLVHFTASSGQDWPLTIAAMARGDYPLGSWIEKISLERIVDQGIEPLHRQEKVKVLVDVGG
jgi:(R,R)-butanediol dehydrogenase/meso-butanediol dehydrogenase/diacetyl reductase